MNKLFLTLVVGLSASWAAGYEEPREEVRIQPILLEESYRPEGSPPRGETAWDLLESAVYKLRKARWVFDDSKGFAYGRDRGAQEWAGLNERIRHLESVHRKALLPGMEALNRCFTDSRAIVANVDLSILERQYFARQGPAEVASDIPLDHGNPEYLAWDPKTPAPGSAAMALNPNGKNIAGMHMWREQGEASSVHAEELLEKAAGRLRPGDRSGRDPLLPNYLDDLVLDAEDAFAKAAGRALETARAQVALLGKDGLFAQAISATAAYGGPEGRESFREEQRAEAVRLSNEAKRRMVANEYRMASRTEELRTIGYLLDRFGRL